MFETRKSTQDGGKLCFLGNFLGSDLSFGTGQLVRVEVVSKGSSHGQDPWESFVERSPRIYCTIEMICA